MVAISTDLDLPSVLTRIIESASNLTSAHYGALGIIGEDGNLVEFITTGLDPHTQKMIGDRPSGRGVLRLLIDDAEPLRLPDLRAHPQSFGFPPHHPQMVTFLGVPIRIRGTVFGNLYLTEKQGGVPFTEQDEVLVQALAGAAGVVIENARAYGLSERRRQWLEETAELTDALQPHIHLEDALRRITNGAQRVSKALGAAVVQFPEDDEPVISAPQGLAFEALEPLLPDIAALAAQPGSYPADLTTSGLTAVLVPLRAHLTESGMLAALFDRQHQPLGDEERELLAAFAEHAGLALDRVQALADRERLAVVSERERIARDLHDVVIQRLFAAGMKLRGLTSPSWDESVAAGVEAALSDLDLTVKDIRSTIFALRRPQVTSLRSQISALVTEYVPVLGLTPAVVTGGPVDTLVSHELAADVLAVLRESLSNIARHAQASDAEVEVRAGDHDLVLRVTDNGIGLPADRRESGLGNVRRRAAHRGGSLELADNEPRGTVLCWRVPLGLG